MPPGSEVPVSGESDFVQAGRSHQVASVVDEDQLWKAARKNRVAEVQFSSCASQVGGEMVLFRLKGRVLLPVDNGADPDTTPERRL